jgi:hypothetical protein
VIRLKTEGKILAGGLPVSDRAFVFIIEARAEMERKVVQTLKSAR